MVVDKDKNLFEENLPAPGTLLISNEVRTNFQALDRANELRPVLGSTPGLPSIDYIGRTPTAFNLYVLPGNYASDGQSTKSWVGGYTPDYGDISLWPAIPSLNDYRTDAIVINSSGALMITIGTPSGSPNPPAPTYPSDVIPIAEIIIRSDTLVPPGITTLDFTEAIPIPTYNLLRDVRPMYVISAAGFGINPKEEILTATSGQASFALLTFTYTVGESEINVYVGGNRKALSDDYIEVGLPGTASSQILFNTGLPLNEKVLVYKVGAASAHRLSDLDDMTVDLANAVIDPEGIRTVSYVGPTFAPNAYLADRNNPFVTLADLKYGAGLIPFGVEHDAVTGVHGPKVTITQPNDDNVLVVSRSHTGSTGAAVVVNNSGTVPGVNIIQSGDSNSVLIQQIGNNNAVQLLHQHTATGIAPLFISRVVGGSREPLVMLRDNTVGGVGANITVASHELTLADETNARRFVFDVSTASLTLQNGGSNNHLTINKTAGGAGNSIQITHVGTSDAVLVNNTGSGAALVLNVTATSTNTIQVVRGTSTFSLDPLWGSKLGLPKVNADAYHTHAAAALNGGLGVFLAEIVDVGSVLSNAVIDVGSTASPIRSLPATADNPLATIDDVSSRTCKIKTGRYTGTGVSHTIALGFQPDWVQLYNESNASQSGVFIANGGTGRRFATGVASITIDPLGTDFTLTNGSAPVNFLGDIYYYIAYKSTP